MLALKYPHNYERALAFATKAHGEQKRKYSGLPYVTHCVNVAALVEAYCDNADMVKAALLHDVLEDTPVTYHEIGLEFGNEVAKLVWWLTDSSLPSDGNRARRKEIDRDHTRRATPEAHSIKLADIIDNTQDISQNDPDFAKVYIKEIKLLMPHLKDGNPYLYQIAEQAIMDAEEKLK